MSDVLRIHTTSSRPRWLQHVVERVYVGLYLLCHVVGWVRSPAVVPGKRGTVVLVSGLLGRGLAWYRIRAALHLRGYAVHVVEQGFGVGDIPRKSLALARYLEQHQLDDVILLAHSMGGIICAGLDTAARARVRALISVGTPWHGTLLGNVFVFLTAARQMRRGSGLVAQTRTRLRSFPVRYNAYARGDEIVVPWAGARLEDHSDIALPEFGHLAPLYSSNGIGCVLKIVEHASSDHRGQRAATHG